jgi:glycosyltransferase involved in cell wall biosynthesis
VGGLPELVKEGETGFFFEAGDVGGLTQCLRRLLANGEQATQVGHAGQQQVVTQFDVSVMAEAYHQRYLELLPGMVEGVVAAA